MTSNKPPDPELLDFERDVPTTPEDIRALRESRRQAGAASWDELQSFADQFSNLPDRRRRSFVNFEPFEL